jgi:subtilisin family serine protease
MKKLLKRNRLAFGRLSHSGVFQFMLLAALSVVIFSSAVAIEANSNETAIFTASTFSKLPKEKQSAIIKTQGQINFFEEGKDFAPGHLIIKFKNANTAKKYSTNAQITKLLKQYDKRITNISLVRKLDNQTILISSRDFLVNTNNKVGVSQKKAAKTNSDPKTQTRKTFNNTKLLSVIEKLYTNPDIKYVEPNYIGEPLSFTDTYYQYQWNINNTGQTGGTNDVDIDLPEALALPQGTNEVTVAVMDDGVFSDQSDMRNRMKRDANGNIIGATFAEGSNTFESNDHGNHVAGIIAAESNNGRGIVGICQQCRIMPIQISFFYASEVVAGFDFAKNNGAEIINMSFGAPYSVIVEEKAQELANSNIMLIAAAGNGNGEWLNSPQRLPAVFSVSATNYHDKKTNYSDYEYKTDVVAPSGDSVSASPANCDLNNHKMTISPANQFGPSQCTYLDNGESYVSVTGTSMASPMVAGVAGLIKSKYPNLTAKQILAQIAATTDYIYDKNTEPEFQHKLGTGRLNAFRALNEQNAYLQFKGLQVAIPDFGLWDEWGGSIHNVEYGQTYTIKPLFKNFSGISPAATAVLSSQSSCVTVTRNTISLPSHEYWGNFYGVGDFQITINQNCAPAQDINLVLTTTANDDSFSGSQNIPLRFKTDISIYHTANPVVTIPNKEVLFTYSIKNNGPANSYQIKLRNYFDGTTLTNKHVNSFNIETKIGNTQIECAPDTIMPEDIICNIPTSMAIDQILDLTTKVTFNPPAGETIKHFYYGISISNNPIYESNFQNQELGGLFDFANPPTITPTITPTVTPTVVTPTPTPSITPGTDLFELIKIGETDRTILQRHFIYTFRVKNNDSQSRNFVVTFDFSHAVIPDVRNTFPCINTTTKRLVCTVNSVANQSTTGDISVYLKLNPNVENLAIARTVTAIANITRADGTIDQVPANNTAQFSTFLYPFKTAPAPTNPDIIPRPTQIIITE